MNVAEDLALSVVSFREALRITENVLAVHPESEATLKALSLSQNIDPGVRALLKCLLALGTFALAQKRAEQTVHALAEAQSALSSQWVN